MYDGWSEIYTKFHHSNAMKHNGNNDGECIIWIVAILGFQTNVSQHANWFMWMYTFISINFHLMLLCYIFFCIVFPSIFFSFIMDLMLVDDDMFLILLWYITIIWWYIGHSWHVDKFISYLNNSSWYFHVSLRIICGKKI